MNLSYSKGAISKILIVNVLLGILILSAVVILFIPDDKEDSPALAKSTLSSKATKTLQPTNPTSKNTRAEIDALEKQLESESSKLISLREDEKRVEAIRVAAEIEAIREAAELEAVIKALAADVQDETPDSDQNEADQTVSEGAEIQADASLKNAVE